MGKEGEKGKRRMGNCEKKGSRGLNGGIEMEEWRKYFMGKLRRMEGRLVRGLGREREGGEGGEERISRREIKETLRRMKDGKVMGIDEMPGP